MSLLRIFQILLLVFRLVSALIDVLDLKSDDYLQTPHLARKYGYPIEIHKVVTDDGYILELHRIPHGKYHYGDEQKFNRKTPVLLQHGLAGSSADWILTGPDKALGYILADKGYDVWLGNNRGNIYSRSHRHIQTSNRTFWDFSFHELGLYDLPAMIDYILDSTLYSKLLYVGHSQGNAQFCVMASLKPEYNAKIKLATGLAPAAFTGNLRGPITQLTKLTYFGVWVGEKFGYPEYGPRSPWVRIINNLLCHNSSLTPVLCGNSLFLVAGFSPEELDMANFSTIIAHVPAGASWKQVVHFGQGYIFPGHFRQFDYGANSEKNLRLYNSFTPPEYELYKITAPIALFSSDNDWLATSKDVELLSSKLRNVVLNYKVPWGSFNHYHFLWSDLARELVYEPLLQLFAQYIMAARKQYFLVLALVGVLGESRAYLPDQKLNPETFGLFDHITGNSHVHEDADLTARQLIAKYGYHGETHTVTTLDGYMLEMHRITGPHWNPSPANKPVVFLMHGLLSSSVDWIISGPGKALAYLLADEGYDVWMGNARGNFYSRKHKYLSTLDKQYWLFSWHEIGTRDLPAMIDHVLKETNATKTFYVGHSQGTTSFYVMVSTYPQYNDKIISMSSLAPVAFVKHMTSPFFQILSRFDKPINIMMDMLGMYEFHPTEAFMKQLKRLICHSDAWTQPLCENIIFLMAGFGSDQMNKTLLPSILGHVPAGSATRQLIHYSQLIKSNKFRQYDYGFIENKRKYGRFTPPDYDLSKIKIPVILHYCTNDWLSDVKDVNRLESLLPNVYAKIKVPHSPFGHLDYLWGTHAKPLLYEKVIGIMRRFKDN
ncbi:uncharacterized protein [Chelonus insularis]|uniref:uncharacterized protein n=1 Tax=Chelonus insularis TaxID=460826 RepID=UPI00158830A0|nr:uncharacterized protein LOC118072912 [Chelonus insularis]